MNPSILVTPNSKKAGKLSSIIPTDGTGDLDVVRATSATRVNEQGLIEIPRTNLLLQSEKFDDARWNKLNVTVTANATISPNGTLTADKIIATATNANHIAYINPVSFDSSQSYTFSYYAKSAEYTKTAIRIGGVGYSIVNRAEINLSNGTIIYQQGFTSLQVKSVGNGWYRIQGTFVSASAITANIQPLSDSYSVSFDNYTFLGDDTSGIFVWGAQLEAGNVATEYIPTTSVIRTRFAGITQDGGSASNIPRFDYSNGSCPSILVEPQRTNIALWSDMFANAYWSKNNSTILPNVETSPDGTMSADKMYPSLSGAVRGIFTFNNPLNTYNFSIYAKAGGKNFLYFYVIGSSANTGVWFNLSTGTIGTIGSAWSNVVIQNAGNGWYRCSANVTLSNASNNLYYFVSDTNNSLDVTANGTDGLFLWGAQLEAGANATSYIPTTTTSVTRNADVISKSGISDLIGQTEGSVFLDFVPTTVSSTARYLSISNSSGVVNGWFGIFASATQNLFRFYGDSFDINAGTLILNNRYKIVLSYKNGILTKIFINGSSVASITANTTGKSYNFIQLSNAPIGERGNANFNNIVLFKTAISDAEAIQLTTL